MNIENIILELKNKEIIKGDTDFSKLSGGTTSELFLVQSRYVIKKNEPQVLETEAIFLKAYSEIHLFPTLIYQQPLNHYIVYSFVEGETAYQRNNKSAILIQLVQNVFNQYKIAESTAGWGWADDPSKSWTEFLLKRAHEASDILQNYLQDEDREFVYTLIKNRKNDSNIQPYLLHGDCGVHNFIFEGGKLTGVIDPTPVIGPRIYDLIYAFCSSPDDLSKETIETAANYLLEETSNLYEEVLIGLYLRIATCIKHHPQDLDEYLIAWDYWKLHVFKEY